MNESKTTLIDRLADRVDLAIDLLTLGEYGLEQTSARDAGCEGGGGQGCLSGRRREALPPVRRTSSAWAERPAWVLAAGASG